MILRNTRNRTNFTVTCKQTHCQKADKSKFLQNLDCKTHGIIWGFFHWSICKCISDIKTTRYIFVHNYYNLLPMFKYCVWSIILAIYICSLIVVYTIKSTFLWTGKSEASILTSNYWKPFRETRNKNFNWVLW